MEENIEEPASARTAASCGRPMWRLAFRLDDQGRISEDETAGRLDVFFPTDEQTHLKFRLHGPFLLTDNRANVKQGDPLNESLVEEASQLLVYCLMELRDKRMLNVATLEVLPIRDTDFPVRSMFRPLFDAVAGAFGKHALLPAHSGGSVLSDRARLARGGDLIELVSDRQLSLAFEEDELRWVSGEITENRSHDLWRYLRHTLGVKELRPDEFCEQMDAAFFHAQPDEWMANLYVFLSDDRHAHLWKYPHSSPLRSKPFLRLETGGHVAPPVPGAVVKIFLPSEYPIDFPTVKRSVCATGKVIAFLPRAWPRRAGSRRRSLAADSTKI